ncbi:MAG: acyloxyacyl hydrolase [Saprospiraceae bacterium]|nr:acyloxyacyl hydrolase [Saprospiraceae bacterium]
MVTIVRIILIFHVFTGLFSQSNSTLWRVGIQTNRLIKHSPTLKFNQNGLGAVLDFEISRQVDGSKQWHHDMNFPSYGIIAKYLYLGNPRFISGDAYGLAVFYNFKIKESKHTISNFLTGTGIAYNTRIYNLLSNPKQNGISTHLNNMTCFEYRLELKTKYKWNFYTGIGLSHFSNGAYQTPNLGLNYVSLLLGISDKKKYKERVADSTLFKSFWILGVNYGYAINELETFGGPKFAVQNLNLEIGYSYRKYNIFKAGIDAENHQFAAYVQSHDYRAASIKEGFNQGMRYHLFGGHEWIIGRSSIETRLAYLLNHNAVWTKFNFYSKIIYQYYLPIPIVKGLSVGAGISIKAVWADAEYLSGILGLKYKL